MNAARTQSLWKNAVLKGLKGEFNIILEVKQTIRALLAVPFIPYRHTRSLDGKPFIAKYARNRTN